MAKYFLEEKEEQRFRISSSIDGKPVTKEGFINEVSLRRHMEIYDAMDAFDNAQADFVMLEAEFASKKIDAEQYKQGYEEYTKRFPELYSKLASVMVTFDGGHPPIEFFASLDFEYSKLIKLRDFFLAGLKNTNAK